MIPAKTISLLGRLMGENETNLQAELLSAAEAREQTRKAREAAFLKAAGEAPEPVRNTWIMAQLRMMAERNPEFAHETANWLAQEADKVQRNQRVEASVDLARRVS